MRDVLGRVGRMRAARLLVLLTLAAVFAMHGLQCVSADPGGTHPADHGALSSTDSAPVMAPAVSMTTNPAVPGHATAVAAAGPAHGAPAMAATDPAGSSSPESGHGWAHALAVCLAVLMAGLAMLAAALLLTRAAPTGSRKAPLARARSWWAAIQLPRPPDLASLCLLRI
jgi:hypothetical protein